MFQTYKVSFHKCENCEAISHVKIAYQKKVFMREMEAVLDNIAQVENVKKNKTIHSKYEQLYQITKHLWKKRNHKVGKHVE